MFYISFATCNIKFYGQAFQHPEELVIQVKTAVFVTYFVHFVHPGTEGLCDCARGLCAIWGKGESPGLVALSARKTDQGKWVQSAVSRVSGCSCSVAVGSRSRPARGLSRPTRRSTTDLRSR
jgi:hypothetical protein